MVPTKNEIRAHEKLSVFGSFNTYSPYMCFNISFFPFCNFFSVEIFKISCCTVIAFPFVLFAQLIFWHSSIFVFLPICRQFSFWAEFGVFRVFFSKDALLKYHLPSPHCVCVCGTHNFSIKMLANWNGIKRDTYLRWSFVA